MYQSLHHRFLPILVSAFFVLLAATNPAAADNDHDTLPHGPKIGAVMASALNGVADQDGQGQSLQTLRGEKGLILIFSRSFDW